MEFMPEATRSTNEYIRNISLKVDLTWLEGKISSYLFSDMWLLPSCFTSDYSSHKEVTSCNLAAFVLRTRLQFLRAGGYL